MPWIIEKTKGVCYDLITNTLKNEKGYQIAVIYEDKNGNLFISQAMETNFVDEEGGVHAGWTGDENHIASHIRLENRGGVLKYCSNRFSDEYWRGIRDEEISIRITKVEGQIIPQKTRRIKRKSIFVRFFEKIFNISVPISECSQKTSY
ncbi:MAG: hypothetical protein UR60_C0026G0004 [Candidatus Moranbacteria bacterium GW2011_GWF2_34_56]|nr:MAG: hypothetical protein UR51_C0002G0141 [Candidatus Moranbacteria bacterium GW2011_GWF1_34_10]KKP64207.1 MAG: hypothetical protein UR60_C0026G0004 [Candidatus Moranbacteria bacterium GW2011_GWF2_34_56]HBI17584.1 hypothetical protein [Candidatus Moranbacteria bacterium]